MNMEIDKHIIDQVIHEHSEVVNSSKQTVEHAIKAGELLSRVKDMCEHGEFLAIIGSKFDFGKSTAYTYMKCYEYSAKVQQLGNLQEAYKLIESEEAKEKQAKSVEQVAKFNYRKQYNEKPQTWERSDDYAWDKHIKAEQATDERINRAKQDMNNQSQAKSANNIEYEQATEYLKSYVESEKSKQSKFNDMNIVNQNSNILDVVGHYLAGLKTDSQRIEECHNIIKYCKNMSVDIQNNSRYI